MGTNTIYTLANPHTPIVDDFNQYFTALAGDLIPRNVSTGAPEDNVNKLGRLAYRWNEAHITNLFLDGSLFDPAAVGVDTKFAINTGATRTDSGQPDFLRADGTGASATILATATPLQITANSTSVTVSADIAITALTVAPGANNTCLVDDTDLTDQDSSKFTGEDINDPLTINTVGSEITDRIGQYICLLIPNGEYMFAFVESATVLNRAFRGFFFDDTGAPVERGTLANNDTLTLMSLGWVFLDNDGVTVDVTYTSPIYSDAEPGSPVTDDYWFDMVNRLWMRYDGAAFQQVDRMLIGLVVIDETDCVVARSFDFTKSYDDHSSISVLVFSNTEVYSDDGRNVISVYGDTQEFLAGPIIWDITTDLETGVIEGADTIYYLYITEDGEKIISDLKYFDRRYDLKGFYHPFHSWRCVGTVENDSGSNFDTSENIIPDLFDVQIFTGSGTWTKPEGAKRIEIIVVGGGGGGGGSDGAGTASGAGGGGGGGGTARKWIDAFEADVTETVTIGAGGNGGSSSGGNGITGGNSSFGSFVTANGGVRGIGPGSGGDGSDNVELGGDGGSGSGDVVFVGEDGEPGVSLRSITYGVGGNGGSSSMGGAGSGVIRVTQGAGTAGNDGNNYGGGGGGGVTLENTTGAAGGDGADGIVIVIST